VCYPEPVETTRRLFLVQSGLLVAAVAGVGCRGSAAPSVVARSWRRVIDRLPGLPTVDGAGVRLTRLIGQPALRHLDPFVLLDRFHSDDPDAYVRGFPDHPPAAGQADAGSPRLDFSPPGRAA
jgi:quercetin 2,3-dioxygenase